MEVNINNFQLKISCILIIIFVRCCPIKTSKRLFSVSESCVGTNVEFWNNSKIIGLIYLNTFVRYSSPCGLRICGCVTLSMLLPLTDTTVALQWRRSKMMATNWNSVSHRTNFCSRRLSQVHIMVRRQGVYLLKRSTNDFFFVFIF